MNKHKYLTYLQYAFLLLNAVLWAYILIDYASSPDGIAELFQDRFVTVFELAALAVGFGLMFFDGELSPARFVCFAFVAFMRFYTLVHGWQYFTQEISLYTVSSNLCFALGIAVCVWMAVCMKREEDAKI